jgi:hypothetical protein
MPCPVFEAHGQLKGWSKADRSAARSAAVTCSADKAAQGESGGTSALNASSTVTSPGAQSRESKELTGTASDAATVNARSSSVAAAAICFIISLSAWHASAVGGAVTGAGVGSGAFFDVGLGVGDFVGQNVSQKQKPHCSRSAALFAS